MRPYIWWSTATRQRGLTLWVTKKRFGRPATGNHEGQAKPCCWVVSEARARSRESGNIKEEYESRDFSGETPEQRPAGLTNPPRGWETGTSGASCDGAKERLTALKPVLFRVFVVFFRLE